MTGGSREPRLYSRWLQPAGLPGRAWPQGLVFLVRRTCWVPTRACVSFQNPMLSQPGCYRHRSWRAPNSASEMTSWWILGDWRTQSPDLFYCGTCVSSSASQAETYYCSVLSLGNILLGKVLGCYRNCLCGSIQSSMALVTRLMLSAGT